MSNCYSHVERQEEYYKKLLKIDPLPAETLESWEINDEPLENFDEVPIENREHFMHDLISYENSNEQVPNIPESPPEEMPQIIPDYICSFCDFRSKNIKVLRNHLKTHYFCDQCDKTFFGNQGKRNYERHLKTHEPKAKKPSKSYQCDQCERSFTFLAYLKRHVERTHKKASPPPANEEIFIVEEGESKDEIENSSRRKQKVVARKLF